MAEKIEVRYEFYEYTENATIDLYNPASVTFINGATNATNIVSINNVILLQALADNPLAPSNYANERVLSNHSNEIDLTQYTIKFNEDPRTNKLWVIAKYFVK